MKLADYKGEDAIELLADIIDPLTGILGNEEIRKVAEEGANNLKLVKTILKHGKKEVLEIMAIIDKENPKTYKPNIFALPIRLLELFSQPEMRMLFISQAQTTDGEPSGSAMANTEVPEK